MAEEIINRVTQSGLITLDLEEFYPKGERVLLDIKDQLWQGLALKEKDFRTYIKETNWASYQDKYVAVYCSTDAIIPTWAYMLLTSALSPFALKVVFGNKETLETALMSEAIAKLDITSYTDARIVIKGCSNVAIPVNAYMELVSALQSVAKSIMFGEACSTVPLWKRPRN